MINTLLHTLCLLEEWLPTYSAFQDFIRTYHPLTWMTKVFYYIGRGVSVAKAKTAKSSVTVECLACVVNPKAECTNCKRRYCSDCRDKRNKGLFDKCPDRPLYGSGTDGHYVVSTGQRPHLLMGSPIVVKKRLQKKFAR